MLWMIQLVAPLALLSLMAWQTARHIFARTLLIAGTAVFLLTLHLAGLWIMLPWWTPWIFWLLFLLALWRLRSIPVRHAVRGSDYFLGLLGLLVLLTGGWAAIEALRARTPPPGANASVSLPLPKGHYYVASGGSRSLLNAHLGTLPRATAGQRNYWGQSHGVDIIATDRWGRIASGETPVIAPCSGRVVRAHDGMAEGGAVDLSSPTARAGNYALLRCGSFDILLAHFRKGSLRVAMGDTVRVGQPIAGLGNSGASDMPHLHFHAQRPGNDAAPFSGQPMPMRIDGRYLVRGDRP